ncbi:MlaD family protein [Actinomadura sp. WMMB 499]|uniref:MlaD family protein n=1 Tax=Actinomadura sp. WMMB 499 TaxID=1219491 RepID=UPI0012494060|nr:MlaD family protein [Actinomadura sp. WMMB 499]QFG22340.1 MCE family protein [Actinomadura sp. WMMB 499]
MNHEIPLRRALLISVLTLVLTALGVGLLVARPFQAEGLRLTAVFGQAGQGLGDGAPVKVRGVTVGSIERMELTGDGRARLTLRLDPGVRVPESVSASIEPLSAFGPKFVELTPGAGERNGPFLASGATIERTSAAEDLSDLLAQADATLSAIDPTEVATVVDAVAQGLNGQGVRLGETIDQVSVLTDVAHRRRVEARRFLADAAGLTGTLAASGSGADLVAINGDANTLIEETAAGGTGRLGAFADELSELSGFVSHGFDKRGGQLGEAFRSGERAAAVIYAQLGLVGDGVRTGGRLLPLYGELTSLAGPEGKNYIRTQGLLPTDPCRLIVGVCEPGGH